jgi:hypothetical protein
VPRRRTLLRKAIDSTDRLAARISGRRRVVFYVRSAMHAEVLDPIARALSSDSRVDVRHLCEPSGQAATIDPTRKRRWIRPSRAAWSRIDLLIGSDPWSLPRLYRCRRRVNFFHGVAGKYNLDDPSHLPIGFDLYERVAFVNEDRMQRYLDRGLIDRSAAVLVGFPKLDALVNGCYDGTAVRRTLGLDLSRPTAIYAPTWSPASSLHLAGEAIVAGLVQSGWNVIVKPHAWSFDPDPKYSGGIDWRQRLRALESPGQVVLCDQGDGSPLLAAADLMVTDHSSIGFEFCLLDRPLIVFDAPDLARVARINPERMASLRRAARVVSEPSDVGPAATDELRDPSRRRAERAAAAHPLFYEPGSATARALAVVYELLDLPLRTLDVPTTERPQPVGVNP